MNNGYTVSTDKAKLDVGRIYDFLIHHSYWARNRSMETVQKSIDNSLCFGVYQDETLVGFARVITDCAVFAWLLDVFVVEGHRQQGIGKLLLQAIMNHPDLSNVKRWMLATRDAHGLYQQYGFRQLQEPDFFHGIYQCQPPVKTVTPGMYVKGKYVSGYFIEFQKQDSQVKVVSSPLPATVTSRFGATIPDNPHVIQFYASAEARYAGWSGQLVLL